MLASTIGYQESTVQAFIDALRAGGVNLLVDVRAIAASRRPGFSKRILANGVAAYAIDYVHLRALGTPAAGREAARAGRTAEMRAIYEEHLQTSEAVFAMAELEGLATSGRHICLLCFERDHQNCHRTVLAEILERRQGVQFTHLKPVLPTD